VNDRSNGDSVRVVVKQVRGGQQSYRAVRAVEASRVDPSYETL
jgi:hypothetical protein